MTMVKTSTLETIQGYSCGALVGVAAVGFPAFAAFHFQSWAACGAAIVSEMALAAACSTIALQLRTRAERRANAVAKVTARLQGEDIITDKMAWLAEQQKQAAVLIHKGLMASSGADGVLGGSVRIHQSAQYANPNKP